VPNAIDHVVVAVHDLPQAMEDYERLGFTVTPGGDHAHRGSHNALITFGDGSYIELIAFKHEPPVKDNTWWDLLQLGEGLVDAALLVDDLPAETDRLAAAGYAVTGPMEGGRLRPDGIRIAWRVARLNVGGAVRLPFVIDDISPHDLRVPPGTGHSNAVEGIAGVTIAVLALADAEPLYGGLLGASIREGDTIRYAAGDQVIALVEPGPADPGIGAFLERFGSGPYRVSLRGGSDLVAGTRELPANLTHGTRFVIA
jgi:hypothetical protein